jgi:threonine dehydrogenase-like Zn-dependent dehydrogenase
VRAITVRPPTPGATLDEVPDPPLGDGEIRVRVLECGVCGTDRDIVAGKNGEPPAGRDRLVLGHENLGRVAEVGSKADGFAPGDLVVATVRRGCGECRFCLSGRSDFCTTGRYTERGIKGRDGYLAEFYTDTPAWFVKVPESLRACAVLLEPLSVVEKALEEGERVLARCEPTPGHPPERPPTVLVTGTGAIGMLGALLLSLRGARVTAVDRHGEDTPAADLLREIGARHVNVRGGLSALGNARYDLILEASGSAPLDFDLVPLLEPNGALVLTGVPAPNASPFPVAGGTILHNLVVNNQAIVGSVNANRSYFERGVTDLGRASARWPRLPERLVTERVPLERFEAPLDAKAAETIKTVLVVSEDGGSPR